MAKKNNPELLIYGAIFESEYCRNSSVKINEFLAEHKEAEEIDVRINSPGGSAYEGMAIYNSLKNHSAKINVYIDGMAASTASLAAMAGDNIYINNCAQMLIHNPSSIAIGDEHAFTKEAENLRKLKESVMNAYLTKTNLSIEELTRIMDEEVTYTASEALEHGFATAIVEEVVSGGVQMYSGPLKQNLLDEFIKSTTNIKNMMIPQGGEKMTLEQLRTENPELHTQILEEGKRMERERIQGLDSINGPGREEMINNAKYVTLESKANVALQIIEKEKTMATQPAQPAVPGAPVLSTGATVIPETVPPKPEPTMQEKEMAFGAQVAEIINKKRGV